MPDGKVVATDISPKMLQIARTRATSLGLNGIMKFRESDGEKIDLLEQTAKFDAILSRCGLMFFPNLPAALGGIRKLLSGTAGFLRLYGLLHQRFHGSIWLLLQ